MESSLPSSFCLRKACPPRAAKYPQEVGTLPVPIAFGESMPPLKADAFQRENVANVPLRLEMQFAAGLEYGGGSTAPKAPGQEPALRGRAAVRAVAGAR